MLGENERIWERLQASRFAYRDRSIGTWVKVTSLLGLEKLGPDRYCRLVPPKPSKDVCGTRPLPPPALWHKMTQTSCLQIRLHLESIATIYWNGLVTRY